MKIGLLWHSLRAGNLGVGALTLGNIAIIREVAQEMGVELSFTVLSMRESATPPIAQDIEQFEIDTRAILSPKGYAAQAQALDLIIDIGAGDSFAEIYGLKRFLFLWLSKWIAVAKGTPLILAPQTIGPFTKQPYRALAAEIMKKSDAVIARDEQSYEAIKDLAPEADSHLAVDVAFKLPFDDQKFRHRGGGKQRIGINASGLLCGEADSGRNRFGLSFDYLELQRRLISYFLQRDDCEVFLVTHANSFGDAGDDDGAWADKLAAEFPKAIRVPDFPGPSEAKTFISGLDFLVAGRMHACIAAFSSLTPVVPISYSRKFSGLFSLLGYPYFTPMTNVDTDRIYAKVCAYFEESRDSMTRAQVRALKNVDAALEPYRQVIRRSLAKIIDDCR